MTYEYSTTGDPAAVAALMAILPLLFLVPIISLVAYVLTAIGLAKIFGKLGQPAWKAWVPYVNTATIIQLGGNPWWWLFVPFANIYFTIIGLHRINGRFGKGAGFTVFAVLLPMIWALVLGGKRSQVVGGAAGATLDQQAGRFAPGVVAPGAVPPPVTGSFGSTTPPPPPGVGQAPGAGFGQPSSVPGFPGGSTPPPPPAPGARPFDAPPPPAQGSPFPAPAAPAFPPVPSAEPSPAAPLAAPQQDDPFAPPSAPPASGLIAPPPGIAPFPSAAPPAPPAPPASAPAPSWGASAPAAPAFVPAPIDDDDDDEVGATIVVDRKPRAQWHLVLADGGVLPVTDEIVVLGRKPLEGSGAQSLSVPDTTRTLSKTHAKLELLQGRWIVTDLNSTNGVIVVRADGSEDLLDQGASAEVLERFVLGKVELRLVKAGA